MEENAKLITAELLLKFHSETKSYMKFLFDSKG